jgi:hypothetical protein
MRIGILTSDDIRHRFFVNRMRAALDVVAVGYQDTAYHPRAAALEKSRASGSDPLDEKTGALVRHHFAERTRQEERFWGHDAAFVEDSPKCRVCRPTVETLNTAETVGWLERAGTQALVVYGTSLIKPPLLGAFPGRTINLHLGLSPYYRGTATNFYPLVNNEPEYVGATIHHIDAGIDSGDIVHQGRPEITADDMPHTVGCKAIEVGIRLMFQAIRELEAGELASTPQWPVPNARLYLRKDYHPRQVVQLYELLEDGLFPRYVQRAAEVAPKVRLVP